MSDLFFETWGRGTPVILVHGSLATGREEWQEQKPLAEKGYELRVVDRRGYGGSPSARGEDFLRDGADIAALMSDGAHLVGHSYGGLGAMQAASLRPEATLSLTLLEPPAFSIPGLSRDGTELVERVRTIWDSDAPDDEWVKRFLDAVGTDPESLPAEVLREVVPLVPLLRNGRTVWDAQFPLSELRAGAYPKLVVSGGHSSGYDSICDALAEQIDARRLVVVGAGHEIQFTGQSINAALLELWGT